MTQNFKKIKRQNQTVNTEPNKPHRPRKLHPIFRFSPLVLFLFSCALLAPPTLQIPTPIPNAPPLPGTPQGDAEVVEVGVFIPPDPANAVTDPVSDVYPDLDPDIATLVNAVSEQQLMAYVQRLESFGTRNAFSDVESQTFGIGAARRWIQQEMTRVGQASNGRLIVENDPFRLDYSGFFAEQENIIATLPGTEPGAGVIVIMAHYDTRSVDETDGFTRAPGANDNGSGIALLIETIRLLSSRTWNQTIIFAALAAEEQGTYGARDLVSQLIRDGRQVIAAINYDTVGGRADIPRSIRLFAPDLARSQSGVIARYYNFMAKLYVPAFPIDIIDALDREGRWGDQREFVYAAMPAIRLTESVEDPDLVNSKLDTWDIIDYTYLRQVTQLNVAVIANMAGAPTPPAPPTVVNMAIPGSFLLTWPRNPNAAGYAIAFREATSDIRNYPPLRFVNNAEAGNVVLTGYDPSRAYFMTMSAIDERGRMSLFSAPVLIEPQQQ
ncbi:MAG: M20/M25/M40 family metallo-hydrolase [Anaerolineae bacterium]